MDIRQMQYVTAVAEYRSFTKAAQALYIAQPSLSSYISKIEQELGIQLFDRTTAPLTVTFAGEEYLKHAREILVMLNLMEKHMQDVACKHVGRIRVGMPNERAAYMMPLLLSVYKLRYPEMEVRLVTGNTNYLIDALFHNQVDIAIMPGTFHYNTIETEEICQEDLVVVGNSQFIAKSMLIKGIGYTMDLKAIEKLPLITLGKDRGIRIFLDKLFAEHGVKPNIIMEVSSNMIAYRMTSGGQGATIIPNMTVSLTHVVRPVQVYSIGTCPIRWKIVAAYRKGNYLSEAERDFIITARTVFNRSNGIIG